MVNIMRTTFKTFKEEETRNTLNKLTNGTNYTPTEIKNIIESYIGHLVRWLSDNGQNTSIDIENNKPFTTAIQSSQWFSCKKFRKLENACDAVSRISKHFEHFDSIESVENENQKSETVKASVYDDMIDELFA